MHGHGTDAVPLAVASARRSRRAWAHRWGYKTNCRNCGLRIDCGVHPRLQTHFRRFTSQVEANSTELARFAEPFASMIENALVLAIAFPIASAWSKRPDLIGKTIQGFQGLSVSCGSFASVRNS